MRELIFTQDVEGLNTITASTSEPVLLTPNLLVDMFEQVEQEDGNRNIRRAVFVSADMIAAFAANGFENMFDPIERVAYLEKGNIGAVLGYQVVRVDNTLQDDPAPEPEPDTDAETQEPEEPFTRVLPPAYVENFPSGTVVCASLLDNEGGMLELHDVVVAAVRL